MIAENARQAESLKAGKVALLGFFVGQVMKKTSGRANPKKRVGGCARDLAANDSRRASR